MKKAAVGCLIALGILIAFLIAVPIVVIATSGPSQDSVLALDIRGMILEEKPDDFFSKLFARDVTTFRDILDAIQKAETDPRINGILARVGVSSLGWARGQELRGALQSFRDTGKWAVAYMDTAGEFSPGGLAYYVASSFDEIFFSPPGRLNLVGIRAEVPFIRGTLDLLRIEPDMGAIGEYKTIQNMYTEKDFTAEHRESLESILDSIYGQLLEGIATERGMTEEEVAAKIDRGPFLSSEALEEGFVDHLMYYDEVKEEMKGRNGGQLPLVQVPSYLKRSRPGSKGRHRIVLIYAIGTIIHGDSSYDPFSQEKYLGSETLARALREAREDAGARAIVLRVDSPGGSTLGSELIWHEVAITAEKKPLVISMANVGASGGYLIAMPADAVIAEPGTLIGSIGVFAGKFNMKGFYNMIGMTKGLIKRGRHSSFFSTYGRWSPEEREVFERMLHGTYDRFLEQVAVGRGMEVTEVDRLGRGRVFTGRDGLELGLIDDLGGLDTAIRKARELADIPETATVQILVLPRPRTLWQSLRHSDLRLPPSLAAWVELVRDLPPGALHEHQPGDLVMPYRIDID
jgi:protease-4